MTACFRATSRPSMLAGLFAAGLALSACDGGHGGAQAQAPQAAPPPPEVAVLTVARQDVPLTFEYAGRVAGSKEVEVRARVGGILLERTYVEGRAVKKGDLLFRIDPETYEVELARAEAHLQQEQARLQQAERNWKRIQPLFKNSTVSARERDEALSALDLAKASVAAAEAEVRAAHINLAYTRVEAPVDGVTSHEMRSEGSLIGTGADDSLLTRITQLDPVYVNFAIPDAEAIALHAMRDSGALRVHAGEAGALPVEVRATPVAGGPGAPISLTGELHFTDSVIDVETGNVRARAVVANPDRMLLPGQFVRVVVHGLMLPDAITVPQKAVLQGPQGKIVYIVDDQNQVQPRPVTTGRAVGETWEVRDGLQPGDRIITEGVMKVRPGSPVRIADIDMPAEPVRQEASATAGEMAADPAATP